MYFPPKPYNLVTSVMKGMLHHKILQLSHFPVFSCVLAMVIMQENRTLTFSKIEDALLLRPSLNFKYRYFISISKRL